MIFRKKRRLAGFMFGLVMGSLVYLGGENLWYAIATYLVSFLLMSNTITTMAIEDPEWKKKANQG